MFKRLGQSKFATRFLPHPVTRVGKLAWRLTVAYIVLLILHEGLHGHGTLTGFLMGLIFIVLVPLLLILFWRFFTRKFLWKVRNRLFLTYILLGLAPLLLLATLTGVAAYILMGQYATNTALSMLDEATSRVNSYESATSAEYLTVQQGHSTCSPPARCETLTLPRPPRIGEAATPIAFQRGNGPGPNPIAIAILDAGKWKSLPMPGANPSPFDGQSQTGPVASWLKQNFRGAVAFHGGLYLCSETVITDGKHTTSVLGSLPITSKTLNDIMKDLGPVTVGSLFDFAKLKQESDTDNDPDAKAALAKLPQTKHSEPEDDPGSISGGKIPPALHFWDRTVYFSTALPVTFWSTGDDKTILLRVQTRPTTLYARLFANSAQTGYVIKFVLLAIAIFFATLEFFALLMAISLSMTITRSIAEIYRGTTEIDRGNLAHRIKIKRKDQLGALAFSFNTMAASITDLLIQQREKDRLVSELAIAQGVQETLFPLSPIQVGQLEVHGVCKPARTVSGDYFDFIGDWGGIAHGGQVCLALGDISGKGISAALVMASLQSAVRALLLGEDGPMSPGRLLSALNWHLYRSTQSNKYATLFLAFYDGSTRTLTYSNGGHLPPLVLSTDGTLQRLTTGGSVVGLLDNQEYPDATIQLQPGDLFMAFSDGLTEPENAHGGEFGEAQLIQCVRENFNKPLDLIVHDTIHHVLQWIGTEEQPDDMTLLLARQL